MTAGQCGHDFVEHAVVLDATAAVQHKDACISGDDLAQVCNTAFAKQNLRGIVEIEIQHGNPMCKEREKCGLTTK